VVLIYAAPGWMDEDNVLPTVTPDEHCANEPSGAMGLCESEPVALLRQTDLSLPQIIELLDEAGWADDEVFGAGSDGSVSLANSPADLLGELNITLTQGEVVDPNGKGLFYSGGVGAASSTCNGWQSQDGAVVGSLGSLVSTEDWFATGSISCNTGLPILCACRSVPDPFS